ncbi:hypothetical protein PHLCEN_2v4089, partial [Hermanssonia centrifuga]
NILRDIPLTAAYKLLITIADFLEDIFWNSTQNQTASHSTTSEEGFEVDQWDDEMILNKYAEAIRGRQYLPESSDGSGNFKIYKITEKVVIKQTGARTFRSNGSVPHEALAIEFVRKHTSIPVPRVIRTIHSAKMPGRHLYVMETIPGKQLGQVWPTLSLWHKLRVAWTLRSYIRQLRRAESTLSYVPGPLGPKPQMCVGFIFEGKRRTAFPDLQSISDWFRAHVQDRRACNHLPPSTYDPFKSCTRMVLTHMDLNMRNILMGKDGRISIVDWDWSGFYPEWFEYTSMFYAEFINGPLSWMRCIPFITNPYVDNVRWLGGGL